MLWICGYHVPCRGRGVALNVYPMSVSYRYFLGKQNDTFWEELGHVKNINPPKP